ncbi:MAG: MATE family efflux transporter [Eubacteriales bacterium]
MTNTNKITQGNIAKEVFFFFIPLVISSFFQHLYGIVDGIIIGQNLGDVAFAAVGGSAGKLITMLINFFVGVSAGVTVYTAQFYGQGDRTSVKKILYNGTVSFFVFGIVLSVLGLFLGSHYLQLMDTPLETLDFSKTYLYTFLSGLVFCVFYNLFSGVLRALGDSKTPLYVLIFCSLLNIFLDLLFVVVIPMGVFGVAFATVTAQGVSALILGYILHKQFSKEKVDKTLDFPMIGNIFKLGIPAGVQSIMYSLSNMLVQSTVNTFGYTTVTAWSAYLTLDSILDVFTSALGSTAVTFVGQNKGAGNVKRIKESVTKIILITYGLIVPIMAIFMFFRVELLGLFTETTAVIDVAKTLFFVIMPMYFFGVPNYICSQAVRGLGQSFKPMIITLVGVVGLRFIWVLFVFPLYPTIQFLGYCYPVSSLLMSIVFVLYYKKEVKQLKSTI